MRKVLILLLAAVCSCSKKGAPEDVQVRDYVEPTEPEVLAGIERWRDLKFGVIFHFGLYSHRGEVESWRICAEDEEWIGRPDSIPYDEYKRQYWGAINEFAPVNLDPAAWAAVCKQAGLKYMVFTTKHHDGFCMWDTRQTDFSIAHGAFKDDPRRDVAKEVFDAFRTQDFMIGAYFSKPDWHSQDYWWDHLATPNRLVNYNTQKHPERWERFKTFTKNQIEELVGGDYGKIDVLVLDGGWVCPALNQDIDMPAIAKMARGHQPGMLIVDRSVPGEYENWKTPERHIPTAQIDKPWESLLTMADDWGWTPDDDYKSSERIIRELVEVVAKGGSLLLGVGPKPDGTLTDEAIERLEQIGAWLDKNGEAIYNTRSTRRYHDGDTWFTRSKDGNTLYAIYTGSDAIVEWRGNKPLRGSEVICLQTGKPVEWRRTWRGVELTMPGGLPVDLPAVAFKIRVRS